MTRWRKCAMLVGLVALVVIVAGCAPGNEMFEEKPAGFWAGLWHGIICVVTFIISLFTDSVRMYESKNAGGWYDFGFLIGALVVLGKSASGHPRCFERRKRRRKEWERIGEEIEEKVRKGLRRWLDESEGRKEEWEEIAGRIEEKIRRELRDWAEE